MSEALPARRPEGPTTAARRPEGHATAPNARYEAVGPAGVDSGRTLLRPHPCPAAREAVYAVLCALPPATLAQLDDGFGAVGLPGALLTLPEWSEMERRFGRRAMLVWVSVCAGFVLAGGRVRDE